MVSNKPGARIFYRFHARDLHLVMGPVTPEAPFRSESSSTVNHRGPHGEAISTLKATAFSHSSACTSSSDNRD